MSGNYYSTQATRPGLLTAIGVLSIVIASVSLLADFGGFLFSTAVLGISSRRTAQTAVAPANPSPAPVANASSEYVAPRGLSSQQRRTVITGLEQVRPISETREKQLDGLLADQGEIVIHISPDNLTTDRVAAYVTEVRDMPSGSGGPPDDMFILGSGRLQLSDSGAVFFPDNSPSPIRSGGGSYTDSSGTTHLASEQIAAVVDRVKTLSKQPVSDTQISALEAELESPTQTMITPGSSVAGAASQVASVQSLGDGTIAVTTTSTTTSFAPNGQVYPGVFAGGTAAVWGTPPIVQRRDATFLMLDAMLSFGAAGFLLACGIMALRNSSASRWMYLGYGIGKILLVVLSCYAVYAVAVQLNAGSPDSQSSAMAWMLITAAPGVIFPVVVLIVIHLKSVRQFLGTPTVGRIF